MTRAALIIICPGEVDKPGSLPGAEFDGTGFKDFLCSDIGGAWDSDEVKVLRNPSGYDIRIALISLRIADYAFVVFSGHGFTDEEDGKVYLQIPGKEIPETDLICNQKQTTIVDACRSFAHKEAMMKNLSEALLSLEKIDDARQLFDKAVQRADPGDPIFLHAADEGETCSVGIDGSYYIQSLIKAGENHGVSIRLNQRVQNVGEAHYAAKQILKKNYPLATQNATITGSIKRNNWFPFAICHPATT